MELKKNTGLVLFLSVCIFCFCSCNDDDEKSETKIEVSVCGQENPGWLQQEVDHVIKSMDEYSEVKIYSLTIDTVEYVALHWQCMFSSQYPNYLQFYFCSGAKITDVGEYKVLYEAFLSDQFTLKWSFRS